jgi:uncharacterized cupin superfamily protein
MPDTIERLVGARTTFGMKKPVVAATTGAITLSGEQTIDGVACVEDDRVLVKDQVGPAFNGIYVVSTGAWTRAVDFDGTTDFVKGTLVIVAAGTINGGKLYRVTSADPTDIDVDSITFESLTFADSHANGSVVVSATVNLDAIDADAVDVTGAGATITAITLTAGYTRIVRFTGANTLTHSATLVLPGAQNFTTASGDFAIFRGYTSGVVRLINYIRGDSHPLIAGQATIASAATTDLGSVREQAITISGVTPITSFGSTAPTGALKFCRLSGAIMLTNGASLILPEGQNLQGADGDAFLARHEGSGVWRVLNYRFAVTTVVNVTATDNAAVSESDLITYSLAANRMASSGAFCRITAWGAITTASTAVARRARLYFGATAIADTGAINLPGGTFLMEAIVSRSTVAGTQRAISRLSYSTGAAGVAGSSVATLMSTPAETLSAAVTIKITGLATGSTGHMSASGLIVEPYPR